MEKWIKGKGREVIHDPRGDIIPVADGVFRSIMVLHSKKGTVRANHWHKTDSHVMYIISGAAKYYKEIDGALVEQVLLPGDSVFTGPNVVHAIKFTTDTAMIVCAENERDYDAYMTDTVKKQII